VEKPATIPHVLACDVGSGRVKIAHVCADDVADVYVAPPGRLAELAEPLTALWQAMPDPKVLVAASVNPAACKGLEAAASQALGVEALLVGRDLPLPIETDLPAPESVGVDRLCAAVAAFDRLGEACVVADFGTAVTVDCVNEAGVFVGGAILPGLAVAARSLRDATAQLPHTDIAEPPAGPGKNTTDAIRTGVLAAARGALRHLVEAFAEQVGHWPLVICTGGDADLVVGALDDSDLVQAVVPDLVLRGVAMAYYRTLVR